MAACGEAKKALSYAIFTSFVGGLLSAGLGFIASMPEIDASTGTIRLTFGFSALNEF